MLKYTKNPIRMSRILFFILCFWGAVNVQAQRFEFTPLLETAYQQIIQLELDKGQKLLQQSKQNDPNNLLVFHIENYLDFFRCFIHEEVDEYEQLFPNKQSRIDKIVTGEKTSPYYRFSQAEILLQWSLVDLKFKKYLRALSGIHQAIKLLEENSKIFPTFTANKKSLSALHAMVGTIPDHYKRMLNWFSSFNGTIEQGYAEIQEVCHTMPETNPFYKEALVTKALMEFHILNQQDQAYKSIQVFKTEAKTNPLLCFIYANLSHKAGKNDEAIRSLQNFKPTATQMPFYYLDYLLGIYKLHRLDTDSDRYIHRYLNYFEGQNYIKEAYQKLAWFAWALHGDEIEYRRNMDYCLRYGNDLIDEDKQAYVLAQKRSLPDRNLLRARLLNDGAYQEQALELLQEIEQDNRDETTQLEYLYRRARIAHGLKYMEEAKTYYLKVLSLPHQASLYFQTAACLYLGQIYEFQSEYATAAYYYKACQKLEPKQYKASLHQKAKTGMLRIQEFIEK